MSFDNERFEICLQCLQEGLCKEDNFLIAKDIREAMNDAKDRLKEKKKWGNVFWYGSSLCAGCPYVLEHIALSNDGATVNNGQ